MTCSCQDTAARSAVTSSRHIWSPLTPPPSAWGGGVRGVQERPELISMRSLRSRSRAAGGSLGSCKSHSNSALRIWLAPGRRRRAIGPFMLAVCKEDRPPLPPRVEGAAGSTAGSRTLRSAPSWTFPRSPLIRFSRVPPPPPLKMQVFDNRTRVWIRTTSCSGGSEQNNPTSVRKPLALGRNPVGPQEPDQSSSRNKESLFLTTTPTKPVLGLRLPR